MSDKRKPPDNDIADASSLFDDGEDDDEEMPTWSGKPLHAPRPKPAQAPKPAATPQPPPPPPSAAVPLGGEYDVEGVEPDDDPPPLPRAPVRPAAPRAEKPSRAEPEDDEDEPGYASPIEANVDEVWTRWGEWGPALTRMGIVGAVAFVGFYYAMTSISFGVAFLILVLGLAVLVALSYPIAVTLERPMRLTPEQAVKDYYAAASHHFPQFRRMWLLLSDQGRDCAEFDSYAAFRDYWVRRMARLRGDRIKKSTPLAFVVKEFHSDKSAGQTAIEAEYTIAVHARGATSGADEFPIETSLVRGPDKMWYLNSGVLPEKVPAGRERKSP